MLAIIRNLVDILHTDQIRYCHWKSNMALPQSLAGETDVDLLVARTDATRFRTRLSELGFRPALLNGVEPFPAVEHYYALDEESGILVHVHAYYRVITGESLVKNYHFPLEELLLHHTRMVEGVPVPIKSAELLVFTLRMMLKHTSPMELFLLARYWQEAQKEIHWLLAEASVEETLRFAKCHLPTLDHRLLTECIDALRGDAPLPRRIRLAYRLRAALRPYVRHSLVRSWLGEIKKFTIMAVRRLLGSKLAMIPQSGGAVIAFVGSEATGKTTLLGEMKGWLGEHYEVEKIHVGKPRATWLTAIPNGLLPTLRSWLPSYRSTNVETRYGADTKDDEAPVGAPPLMFAIRSVLLAYDRNALLLRAYSRAANGAIVLCDRYPSIHSGALDSPQLSHLPVSSSRFSLRRWLTALEARLYREIPPPDLVVYLTAPLEVTVARNATRGKREPEDYVRRRHARSTSLEFGTTPVCRINTDQPFDQTVRQVKQALWEAL